MRKILWLRRHAGQPAHRPLIGSVRFRDVDDKEAYLVAPEGRLLPDPGAGGLERRSRDGTGNNCDWQLVLWLHTRCRGLSCLTNVAAAAQVLAHRADAPAVQRS